MKLMRWPLVGVLTAMLLAGSVAYAAVGGTSQDDEPKAEDTTVSTLVDGSSTTTVDDDVEAEAEHEDELDDETTSTSTLSPLAATTSTTVDDQGEDEDENEDEDEHSSITVAAVTTADGTYAFTLPDGLGTITVTVDGGDVTDVTVPDGWDAEIEYATVEKIEIELERSDAEVDVEIRDLTDVRVRYDSEHDDHDSTTDTTVGESHDD